MAGRFPASVVQPIPAMAAPSLSLERDLPHSIATARRLDQWNRWRLLPGAEPTVEASEIASLCELELDFVERERAAVRAWAAEAPQDPHGFVSWFEQLEHDGPGQHDALFPWLEHHASLQEMTWFLRQEVAGEAGFDDLVALTQVKLPTRAKLELARNYWDEMGQGHEAGMHGPMLARLAEELGIDHGSGEEPVWESVALANLMMALAVNRRYAYHSLGALGVIELTAPGRARAVNAGLKRLGVAGEARRYFALHATLDVKHAQAWTREVLAPLVSERPAVAALLAEGALLRLVAGARCFTRYRRELGLEPNRASRVSAGTPISGVWSR
jgi:hypothetical protein